MGILFKRIRVVEHGPFVTVYEKQTDKVIGLIWPDGFEPFSEFFSTPQETVLMVHLQMMSEIGVACLLIRPTRL
jgi:hypothetical protein